MTLPYLLAAICLVGLIVIGAGSAWRSFIRNAERAEFEGPWGTQQPRRVRVEQGRMWGL